MNKLTLIIIVTLLVLPLSLVACGGQQSAPPVQEAAQSPVGDAVKGKTDFEKACSTCHGPEGKGVQGLGKDMTTSVFIADKSDAELVAFIKTGRPSGDPLNTTGIDMPPKGGNPALSDDDLYNIVAFIRTIHVE